MEIFQIKTMIKINFFFEKKQKKKKKQIIERYLPDIQRCLSLCRRDNVARVWQGHRTKLYRHDIRIKTLFLDTRVLLPHD